jgi:hypothetical protein
MSEFNFVEVFMSKRRKSPGDRLILIICGRHGSATLREIARAHLTGADFDQAKVETAGLVVFEPTYQNGRRSRSLTARLTARGIWQAIRLTRGYDEALAIATLAAADVKALLARLEQEKNPLALELAANRADAEAYRAQQKRSEALERKAWETIEKVQEILALPPRKISAKKRAKLAKFLESHGVKLKAPIVEAPRAFLSPTYSGDPAKLNPIPSSTESTDTAAPAVPPMARPAGAPREFCPICDNGKYDWRQGECPQHDCGVTGRAIVGQPSRQTIPGAARKSQSEDPRTPLIERIKKAGYQTRGNHVLYNNERYIEAEEWARLNPHINL